MMQDNKTYKYVYTGLTLPPDASARMHEAKIAEMQMSGWCLFHTTYQFTEKDQTNRFMTLMCRDNDNA